MWPVSKAGKARSWRSCNSSQSRSKASAAWRRAWRSHPLVRMTPPISQKRVVMVVKAASHWPLRDIRCLAQTKGQKSNRTSEASARAEQDKPNPADHRRARPRKSSQAKLGLRQAVTFCDGSERLATGVCLAENGVSTRRKWMANDNCGPTPPPPSEPVKPGTRMVQCVKIGKELPGLDRVPWKGELGQRVYDHVSKEAWKLWVEYSKMVMNEYRLNPLDPNSQKIMGEQMEQFFFGEGAKLPEGYVAPKAKG